MIGQEPALHQLRSEDGKRVVSVVANGGLFRYVEENELWQAPSHGMKGYSYWAPTETSGLYASADDALLAAMSLPWVGIRAS